MANKKVSQLVSKPSVLVTDLFPIADPTTGQLFKTTISDLGTAIGSGVSSVNTLVGAVVLDTDDIQELASPTNRWYTDTRSRAAISAGTGISYNSGTGVITNAVTSGQIATALGYTPADDALVVKLAGSQTITGTKTFQQAPLMDIGVGYKNGSGVYNYLKSINTGWEMPVNGQNHNLIFSTSTNYTYTFPNASGTIALTSNLSAYVPYTGATAAVDLGANNLSAKNLIITGAASTFRQLSFYTAGSPRWSIYASNLPETGSNAGSDFVITKTNDDGVTTDPVFTISRATGYTQINFSLAIPSLNTAGIVTNTSGGLLATSAGTGFLKMSSGTISYDNSTYALDSAVVKLTGAQTIAGTKTFSDGIIANATDGNYFLKSEDIEFRNQAIGNSIRLHGTSSADQAYLYFGSNTSNNIFGFDSTKFVLTGVLNVSGNFTASTIIKSGGTSSQFLKADGSVDTNAYLPLSGGTLTGTLSSNFSGTFSNLYSTGNSGIGTLSTQSITNGISLTIGDATTQHQPYLAFRRNPTGGYWAGINWYDQTTRKSFIEENSNFDLRFGTSNTLALTIFSSGAASFASTVGIGTSTGTVSFEVLNSSAAVANNPGNSQIRASATSTKFLSIGYDGTTNAGYLQGAEQGISWRPIILNLNGTTTSPVLIGQSTSDGVNKLQVSGSSIFSSSSFNVATFSSTFGQMSITFANSGTGFGAIGSGDSVTSDGAVADDLGIGTAGLNKSIVFATGTGYSRRMTIKSSGIINFSNVPTSSAGLSSGDIYKSAGVLMIV